LLWATANGNPLFAFDVSVLASAKGRARIKDLKEANRILEGLKKESCVISSRPVDLSKCQITVMSDASFQTLDSGKSQAGFIINVSNPVHNEKSRANLIHWKSSRVKRVVHSTLGAELLSAVEALDCAEIVRYIFSEIVGRRVDLCLYSDCMSLVRTSTKEILPRQKSLVLSLAEIRQYCKIEGCHHPNPLCHINTQHMLADGLTKRLSQSSHNLKPLLNRNEFIKKDCTLRVKYGEMYAPL